MNFSTLAISPPIDRILRGGGKVQVNSDGSVTITPAGGLGFDLDGSMAWDTTLGSEKVTNGSFTGAATGWTLAAGWTYNTNAVDKDGDGTGTLSQDVSAVANEVYKVVYTVSGWSVGTVTVAVGGVSGTARGANGTYTEYIAATGTGSLTCTPTNTARLTVDTVSVKRVAVVAADRVTMWAGDRTASGVEAAGDAGLFIRSEDGTLSFIGDTTQLGGALLINATAAYADNGQLLEVNKSADDGGIALFCWSTTDAERALLEFHKSSSATIGTKALVADEEAAGGIIWKVADGAVNWSSIASIEGFVDTAPGAGDTGGRLVFYTTADGAASVTERMRLDSAGNLGIGGTAATRLHSIIASSGQSPTAAGLIMENNTHQYLTIASVADTQQLISFNAGGQTASIGFEGGTRGGLVQISVPATLSTNGFDVSQGGNSIIRALQGGDVGIGVTAPTVKLQVDDVIGVSNDAEGSTAHLNIRSKRILTAALSGATVNMAFQIPSGAMLLGAQFNVNALITGATSWSAAFNTGSTTSLGTGLALTLDTKVNKLIVPEIATAATDITLTAAGSNFTAGVIEGIVYYVDQTNMANA